jgi:haloalkane dehalogenase
VSPLPSTRRRARAGVVAAAAGVLVLTGVGPAIDGPAAGTDIAQVGARAAASEGRPYRERWIRRGRHRIYAREYPGRGPAIVLMHGFPDDLSLYDRLVAHLRGRHVVTFDFLGWGRSQKPRRHDYTFGAQQADLDAVVRGLGLEKPILVPHDSSGPAAINWALDHPGDVGALALLNTFYGLAPTLRPPEAIAIFGDLLEFRGAAITGSRISFTFERLTRAIARDRRIVHWLHRWQVGGFIRDPAVRRDLVPRLWRRFGGEPSSIPAFLELNRDLPTAVLENTGRAPELASLRRPVRIIFGASDPTLNAGVARHFHGLFPGSELHLLRGARHYVQVDEPRRVARLLRSIPGP